MNSGWDTRQLVENQVFLSVKRRALQNFYIDCIVIAFSFIVAILIVVLIVFAVLLNHTDKYSDLTINGLKVLSNTWLNYQATVAGTASGAGFLGLYLILSVFPRWFLIRLQLQTLNQYFILDKDSKIDNIPYRLFWIIGDLVILSKLKKDPNNLKFKEQPKETYNASPDETTRKMLAEIKDQLREEIKKELVEEERKKEEDKEKSSLNN